MIDVNLIVDYVITRAKIGEAPVSLTHLKLQKMIYYIQAWSLGIKKKKMFDEAFEAWIHGPVCRKVYDRFAASKNIYSEITLADRQEEGNFEQICDTDSQFIDYILENYLGFSGAELEEMSHQERPWQEARRNLGKFERSNNVISEDSMKVFYGQKWETLNNE